MAGRATQVVVPERFKFALKVAREIIRWRRHGYYIADADAELVSLALIAALQPAKNKRKATAKPRKSPGASRGTKRPAGRNRREARAVNSDGAI